MDKQILFTEKNKAELLDVESKPLGENDVKVETYFSTISCGTERANITGDANVAGNAAPDVSFPRSSGYSSSGIVREVGSAVEDLKVGDRVVVFWGKHKKYNIVPSKNAVKIEDDNVSFEEAAMSFIASFSLAAIRKTRLEIGESALVMGLGILGQLAVRLLKAAGAVSIIAADPIEERRKESILGGADFAFDPTCADFPQKVKEITGTGVKTAIEVTGVGAGLDETLDCMAKFGRVALLGCTRDKNFTIDYYKKVHFPGITLVGAHTLARPDTESYPANFTHRDDIKAILKLLSGGRLTFRDMIKETHSPADCKAVYDRLINNKNFPVVVQFDWRECL